ncbi:MAG: hypothetical protein JWQ25_1064, partial [Daejeonella sp.]|nr:hypothetical protein [Daejeonella sp.]
MLDINKLNDKLVSELREIAQNSGIPSTETLRKQELISKIIEKHTPAIPLASELPLTADTTDAEKQRKRIRTIKKVKPEIKTVESAIEDTRVFDLPEEEEEVRMEEPAEIVAAPVAEVQKPDRAEEAANQTNTLIPKASAVNNQPSEARKFERRPQNQNQQNRNQEPPINMDFDNVIVNEGILEIM